MAYDTQAFRWTPERIGRMRELLGTGHSFGLIATELGCTRNSVIGKAHRLGIKTVRYPTLKCQAKRPAYRKPSNPSLSGIFTLRAIGAKYVPKPPPMTPAGKPCGILDVTGCKYAIGEDAKTPGKFLFCNASRSEDSPWCEHHRAICTQPAFGRYAMTRMAAP